MSIYNHRAEWRRNSGQFQSLK